MDAALPWSEAFEIGVPVLDADHRRLVTLINQVCAALGARDGERLFERLDRLCALAAAHFQREEAVLARIPVSGLLESHSREHETRLAQLESIRAQCRESDGPPSGIELGEELIDWFVKQAIGHDAKIKVYLG